MSEIKKQENKSDDFLQSRFKLLFALLVVLFFIASAYGVQRTVLSSYAGEKEPVETWFETGAWLYIAFTLAGFGLFKSIAGLFSGPYTNKYGVKHIIITGAGCFTLGSIGLVFSYGDPLFIGLGNSILGAGEGLLYAGSMTYLSNVSHPSKQAQWLGVMELAVYAGYSFGALASGLFTMLTGLLQTSFIFSFVISSVGLLISIIYVKSLTISSTKRELQKLRVSLDEPEKDKKLSTILFRPTVVITFLSGHISKMVDSIIVLYLPLVLSHTLYGYQLSIGVTGTIIASFTLTWALTMPLSGRISDAIGRKKPIISGLIIEAVALLGLSAGSFPTPFLFLLSALGGIGVGLYYPILPSIAVDVTSDEQKSYFIGFFRAFKDLGYFTGPVFAGFIALLWYDTNPQLDIVLRVPLSIASLILVIAAIGLLLVRETRPGWLQFETSLDHARLVEESVIASTKGILVYLEQETIEEDEYKQFLEKYTSRAKKLEVEADKKLEEIVTHTYQSLHNSPDAGNFIRIARRLDRVAGLTLGALFRFHHIPLQIIPPLVQERLHDAVINLRSLVRLTVDVLQVLDIKINVVTDIYHTIRDRESDLDRLYQIMNHQMSLSATHMQFGIWYEIKEVINMIEQAADSTEDAAEVINILAIKYKT